MFHDWDDVFLLLGPAAGGLIGLLFVVATLTGGRDLSNATRGATIYLTPTVFHFGVVMSLSAVAMTPRLPGKVQAVVVFCAAAFGLGYAAWVAAKISGGKAPEPAHWSDAWCYGVGPAAAYLGLCAGAVLAWCLPTPAPYAITGFLLVLLLIGIRNAWDLVTFLAPRAGEGA